MTGLLESATGLTLLQPWVLILVAAIPVLRRLRVRGGRPALAFAPLAILRGGRDRLPRSLRSRLLWLPPALGAAGLLLLLLALARPVHRTVLPLRSEGIDLLLCIDASSSMNADDPGGTRTRLEVAREAAAEFLGGRATDRVGLVRFARWPDLLCPPTLDHDALGEILASVTTVEEDGPEDATGIGAAVALAARVLREEKSPSKVVILLTDGEENVAVAGEPGAIPPLHAAQLCRRLGVRVHVVATGAGAGRGGGPPPDTRAVREMAVRTGGTFFEARDAAALSTVYADIDALERTGFERPRVEVEERFAPFLLAALALLLVGRLLRGTWLEVLP